MLVTHKLLVSLFVEDDEVETAVGAIAGGAATGQVGDGLVAVSEVTVDVPDLRRDGVTA